MELPLRFVKRKDKRRGALIGFDLHRIARPNDAALQDGSVGADPRLVVARCGLLYGGVLRQITLRQRGHHAPSTRPGNFYFYFAANGENFLVPFIFGKSLEVGRGLDHQIGKI
jgi:hypothetical protein